MAKKKEFDNIVEESFNEGYQSEPDLSTPNQQEPATPSTNASEPAQTVNENEGLSEKEIMLRKITAGEAETLNKIWGKEDRSTYYLTDLHRACIDIMAHEEGMKKNEIVVNALNNYFTEDIKNAAKERVITMAVKKLEREIKKENK